MATQKEVVSKVRRRVSDYQEDVVYSDDFYIDAIESALSKLNYDLSASYSFTEDVPSSRLFLLIKLATIQMAFIRATEGLDKDGDGTGQSVTIDRIKVPDLEIEGESTSPGDSADKWMGLAQKLQNEYDDEIDHIGGSSNAAQVQVGYLKRISLTTGGYRKYALDEGLSAVTVSAVVTGNDVKLSWSTLYDETFASYDIHRSVSSDMSDSKKISSITDNHVVTYTDKSVPSGSYYYQVKTVNRNALKTDSNTLAVTVS